MNKKVSTLTFAILAIFLLVGLAFTEGYRREFKPNELDLVKGAVDVEDGQETAGLFSQGPGVNLPKGAYQFKLCYMAQAEDSSVAVFGKRRFFRRKDVDPLPGTGVYGRICHLIVSAGPDRGISLYSQAPARDKGIFMSLQYLSFFNPGSTGRQYSPAQ